MIGPREPVIMAEDFSAMVAWYRNVLKMAVTYLVEDDYHYANLETESGVKIGIADAKEMGVVPGDRRHNTVVLQIDVPNVQTFFDHIAKNSGTPTFGPSFDEKGQFWYGGFNDLEGNPIWVVDENC